MCYSVMVETDLKRLGELTGASLDLEGLLRILTQYRDLSERPEDIEALDLPLKGALKIPRGFKKSLEELVSMAEHSPLRSLEKDLAEQCLVRWSQWDQRVLHNLVAKKESQEKKVRDLRDLASQRPTKTNLSKHQSAERALEKINADLAQMSILEGKTGAQTNSGDHFIAPQKTLDTTPDASPDGSVSRSVFQYSWAPLLLDLPDRGKILRFHRYQVRPRGSSTEPPAQLNMFNARLDSLTTRPTWRPLFMSQHAALYLRGFYEWVPDPETQKPRIVRFSREGQELFWVPCLYERWHGKWSQGDFHIPSFAIVTTEPPEEVLRAGHDRCPAVPDQDRLSPWLKAQDHGAVWQDLHKPHGVRFVHQWAKP